MSAREVPRSRVLQCVAFSALLCTAIYFTWRRYDVGLGDDGYLWYGVKRTVAGEVPLRDFQSYDPGRYYWCAAFAPLVGDGLLGVRFAATLFQAIGLSFALLVCTRFTRNALELAGCALLVGLWMFPRHKLFEPAMASIAVWFVLRLVEQPSTARHLAAGLYAGGAGFIGRNHALYAALASGIVIAWLAWNERGPGAWKRAAAWAAGGLAGYSPMWAMFLFVPGFFASFLRTNELIAKHGTNVPLPFPWPWRTDWSALAGWELAGTVALTLVFLLPVLVLPIGLFLTLRNRGPRVRAQPVAAAAAITGALYVHHMSVRAHWSHLAECLPPALLLFLYLGSLPRARWFLPAAWGGFALVSACAFRVVASPLDPLYRRGTTVECQVDGETLRLRPVLARTIEGLRTVISALVPPDEPLLVAPGRPGLYPILGRTSPTWWIYFLWEQSPEDQRALIDELARKSVDWVLIVNRSPDDVEERLFANTHALVWQHLTSAFDSVLPPGALPNTYALFHRREPAAPPR